MHAPSHDQCPKPWPMPQAMTNIAQAAWISGCIFLTQGTVPNLHQIRFFIFCVNKGFRFMLVYSCLHYLLFKNEKVFCFLSFPYFHDKTRSRVGSSVPSLNGNSRSEHDYEFEHFSGHSLVFQNAHWLHFGSDTTLLPLPPIPSPKDREDEEIALNFPLVVLASCGTCKHPKQIL